MSKLWLTLAMAMCSTVLMCQTPADRLPDSGAAASSTRTTPPSFSYFTVNTHSNAAVLKWGISNVRAGDYFIIEKSADGNHFETMSAMASGSFIPDTNFTVTDNAVGNGLVYYRIRIAGPQDQQAYSKIISTSLNLLADFRFYPNPVDKLLIIRCVHPVSIQVMDGFGIILLSQDLDAGMQIINVSTLQKGSYILKATNRETNATLSQQLIKN